MNETILILIIVILVIDRYFLSYKNKIINDIHDSYQLQVNERQIIERKSYENNLAALDRHLNENKKEKKEIEKYAEEKLVKLEKLLEKKDRQLKIAVIKYNEIMEQFQHTPKPDVPKEN